MNFVRVAAWTMVASGIAVALHVGLAASGVAPFFPAAAAAACVAAAGSAAGARAGVAAGALVGAGLALVKWGVEVELGGADVLGALVMAAIGGGAGAPSDRLRRRLEASTASELDARRESYRLRRDVDALTAERDAARARKAAAPAPEAAPVLEGPPSAVAGPDAGAPSGDAELDAALRRVASALNEARLFATVLESAVQLTGAERVALHLHDRRADRFQDGLVHPAGEKAPVQDREPMLRAALRRRELIDRRVDEAEFRLADPAIRFVAPVFDRVILAGLLVVEGGEPRVEDRERLSILVTAFGLALSAVRLVGQLEQRDRTDPLTGLPSVAEIRETLARSLERGRTAALLFAADGIREVNEKYGRKAGDKAVQSLSKLLALEVGADGTVGRYGGATMLVVLPGQELDAAVSVAERVLRRVPTSIPAGPEGLAKPLTASVGAAAATVGPVDALLGQAEAGLKRAQDAGGGRCATETARGTVHA